MTRPTGRTARAAHETRVFNDSETIDDLCRSIESGRGGMAAWCRDNDCRYAQVLAWVESDPSRAEAVALARRSRAGIAADTIDAIGCKLVAPALETGIDGVDAAGKAPIDAKAARVAIEALRFGAQAGDRLRFGRQVQHTHLHTMQAEHLQALRLATRGAERTRSPAGPIDARALPAPIDAEFRVMRPTPQDAGPASLDAAAIRAALRFPRVGSAAVNVR